MIITIIFAFLIGYLIGSLSSAIIVCHIMRLPDPRTQGSQNPGATNVLRIGGKLPAMITLLGDMLKGLLPILIAKAFGFDALILVMIALGAFLGHLFPVFFRFEGGKGVATALGCLLALSWPSGACALLIWITLACLTRYSSLSSLITFLCAPFLISYFTQNAIFISAIAAMSVILIYRHRSNIIKLYLGTESRIGKKIVK